MTRAGEPSVRLMGGEDVPRVVDVHLSAFDGFFLSSLGRRFLALFYAEAIALGEIAFVVEVDGRVVGLVMGSARPGEFFSKLLRRRAFAFARAAVPALIRSPGIALRLARALSKPRDAARPVGTATLMSLGVAPEAQSLGTGRMLVRAFCDEAQRRGAVRVDLTTDKAENERANVFYERLGFRVAREIHTSERRVLNEYEIDLRTR